MLSKVLPSSRRGLFNSHHHHHGASYPSGFGRHALVCSWVGVTVDRGAPEPCVLPFWARLTLPLAFSLHHDVSVQRSGHGVGQLRTLQKRRHGAAGDARAVSARLCRWLPDLRPGLRGGEKERRWDLGSRPSRASQRKLLIRCHRCVLHTCSSIHTSRPTCTNTHSHHQAHICKANFPVALR